jgi:hypothetical protein
VVAASGGLVGWRVLMARGDEPPGALSLRRSESASPISLPGQATPVEPQAYQPRIPSHGRAAADLLPTARGDSGPAALAGAAAHHRCRGMAPLYGARRPARSGAAGSVGVCRWLPTGHYST